MTTPNEELLARAKRLRYELDDSNARLDRLCVTAMYEMEQALQSQAERIATLEGDVEYLQEDIDAMCNAIPSYHWRGGAAELIAKCFAERDTLRAQIAAIDATEPIARAMSDKTNTGYVYVKVLADKIQFGTNLYSHPMPAQDVTELVELLEFMWRDVSMNEYAFEKLEAALSKYKGAK